MMTLTWRDYVPLTAAAVWAVIPVAALATVADGNPWLLTGAMLSWLPWILATVYVYGSWLVRRNSTGPAGAAEAAGLVCEGGAPAAGALHSDDAGEPNNRTPQRASIRLRDRVVG